MPTKQKLKPQRKFRVIIRCKECGATTKRNLRPFVKDFGEEYAYYGFIQQYCSCRKTSTIHTVIGMLEEKTFSCTIKEVFELYKKEYL